MIGLKYTLRSHTVHMVLFLFHLLFVFCSQSEKTNNKKKIKYRKDYFEGPIYENTCHRRSGLLR